MSADKTGGPAFPSKGLAVATDDRAQDRDGMTLRDWFAGQALLGMVGSDGEPVGFNAVASQCYKYADAMLVERAK